jgi:membrane protein DedA with SNARE-associated domain/rhodanese-related sulfurtransferase
LTIESTASQMDMLLHLIASYGLLVVFVSVFLDQGGLPIPAYPPLIVAAAVATDKGEDVLPILAVATLAAVLADLLWFAGGRRFGVRLLRLMCRLSLSPDSCVLTTRDIYARWGASSLIGAKFVPGFAAVATTLAGENQTPVARFVFFDSLGALLWAGVAVALGVIFHQAVNEVLLRLEDLGRYGLSLVIVIIAAFVAYKWWQRQRFLRELKMARITVPELYQLLAGGAKPLILDVRSAAQRNGGWIPGAVFVASLAEAQLDPQEEVIVYCDCPNEASAALLARELKKRGFGRVRPLAGGFHAWQAEGHEVLRDA